MFIYEDCYISAMGKIVTYVSEEENSYVRNENQVYENRSSWANEIHLRVMGIPAMIGMDCDIWRNPQVRLKFRARTFS